METDVFQNWQLNPPFCPNEPLNSLRTILNQLGDISVKREKAFIYHTANSFLLFYFPLGNIFLTN